LDEANVCWRKAIEIDPKYAPAHSNLGLALVRKGQVDEAIACYKKAIELDPKYAAPHLNLGAVLERQGKLDEAITEFRTASRLQPNLATANHNVAILLERQGKLDEAITEYRTVIRLQPKFYRGHYNLGVALKAQGQFDEALSEFRRAAPGGADIPFFPGQMRQLEQQIQRLSDVLRGEAKPRDNAERLAVARLGYDRKKFAAAARLWAEAFKANPGVANDLKAGHRYSAACAAALAGSGQTADDPLPDEAARRGFRTQARDWLRADLGLRSKQLGSGTAEDRAAIVQALQHWQQDSDLAGIRDKEALAKLPAEEQEACTQLWADVAALLKKAEAGKSP